MSVPPELLKWITPDETAAEFLTRQSVEAVPTGLPFIDKHITLRPGTVLEIVGPAGAAKSEILIQVVVNLLCSPTPVLQQQDNTDTEHVVVVDCGGNFDLLRLIQVLKARAEKGNLQLDLHSLLQRLHVLRCFSSLELLMALGTLPSQLRDLQGRCKMLLLDNMGAFYWHERAAMAGSAASAGQQQQQQQLPHSSFPPFRSTGPGMDASRAQGAAAALLRGICQQLRCPVIVTKQALVKVEPPGGNRLQQKEVLTEEWKAAVSCRLLLSPVVAAGQALHVLASGPRGTQVLLQWQACNRPDTGLLELYEVSETGGLVHAR